MKDCVNAVNRTIVEIKHIITFIHTILEDWKLNYPLLIAADPNKLWYEICYVQKNTDTIYNTDSNIRFVSCISF